MGFDVPFTVRAESRNGIGRVDIGGELDMATAPRLDEPLSGFDGNDVSTIVLDLRDVTFMDSSAVHAFVRARKRAEADGRQLILMSASDRARRLFQLTGTQFLLDEHDAAWVIDRFAGSHDGGDAADDRVDGEPDA